MAAGLVYGPAPPPNLTLAISPTSRRSTTASESPIFTPNYSLDGRNGTTTAASSASSPEDDDDGPTVAPKIEEVDDDDGHRSLGSLSAHLSPTDPDGDKSMLDLHDTIGGPTKRPRGRPRKHPVSPTAIAKGRSKTGCITCRKRKKKCDETKPVCMHCQKNNVVCEGYPPRSYWKSGRQRKSFSSFDRPSQLPVLIAGVETDVDRLFLQHFGDNVSRVLSLFTDENNPFNQILLPMAVDNVGLMHSLLCLSGSHLASVENNATFQERQLWHYGQALHYLGTDEGLKRHIQGQHETPIDDPVVAQVLVLCLHSIAAGQNSGEYRLHIDAAKHFIKDSRSKNTEFQNFLVEFFVYHDVASTVTSLDRVSAFFSEDFNLPDFLITPEASSLLGVVDSLFGFISRIRNLRCRVRDRKQRRLVPTVDYTLLAEAQAIDMGVRDWECKQEYNSPRYIASLLYQQCTWVYLYRTTMSSRANAKIHEVVEAGLSYLRQLPPDGSTQSILLMPVFLLGCAAFDVDQRPDVSRAFDNLQAYSSLGNIRHARRVVELMWKMMDEGDEDSWDWEAAIHKLGMDFLVT